MTIDGLPAVPTAGMAGHLGDHEEVHAGHVANELHRAAKLAHGSYGRETRRLPAFHLVPGGEKIRGGNITVKPAHTPTTGFRTGVWASFYNEWDWAGWIKPQIDNAKKAELNCVRLIGDIYGIKTGVYSQAAYLDKWKQLIEYCADIGMMVVGGGIGFHHTPQSGATDAEILSLIQAWGTMADPYPNVVCTDLYSEWTNETGIGAALYARVRSILQAHKAVSSIPATASFGPGGEHAPDYVNAIKDDIDFWSVHYYYPGAIDLGAFNTLVIQTGTRKPVLVGEFGVATEISDAEKIRWTATVRDFVASRPDVVGALQWAMVDQTTNPADMFGLYDSAGVLRPAMSETVRSMQRQSQDPFTFVTQPTSDFTIPAGIAWYVMATSFIALMRPVRYEVIFQHDIEVNTAGNIYSGGIGVNISAISVGGTTLKFGPSNTGRLTICGTQAGVIQPGYHELRFLVAHSGGSTGDGVVYAGNSYARWKLFPL